MIWFTSDLHFNHKNILEYCDRPYIDVDDMSIKMIETWNKHIHPKDTVWILGDITLGKYKSLEPIFKQLNGRKFLVKGNHDKFSNGQYHSLGFDLIFDEVMYKISGERVRISHYPHRPEWWKRWFLNKGKLRYMDRRPPKDGIWLMHGHTHDKKSYNLKEKTIHVGWDAWLRPVSIKEIESIIDRGKNK